MKKNNKFMTLSFLGLLMSSSVMGVIPKPLSPSMESLAAQVRQVHADDFADWDTIDWDNISDFVKLGVNYFEVGANSCDRLDLDAIEDSASARKILAPLKAFLEKDANNTQFKRLLNQIDDRLGNKECSKLFVWMCYYQAMILMSDVSKEEISLLFDFGYTQLLTYVQQNRPTKLIPLEKLATLADFKAFTGFSVVYLNDVVDANTYVNIELEKAGIISYPVPLFGIGKFTISTLLSSFFKEKHIVAAPHWRDHAHGLDTSPLSFMLHDGAHLKSYGQIDAIKQFIQATCDKILRNNENPTKFTASEILKSVTALAIKHHQRLTGAFDKNHDFLKSKFVMRDGIEAYRRVIVPFFYALHENMRMSPELLAENDLDKVIDRLMNFDGFEYKNNYKAAKTGLFGISLITGETSLTDAEIIKIGLEHNLFVDKKPINGHVQIRKEDVNGVTVSRVVEDDAKEYDYVSYNVVVTATSGENYICSFKSFEKVALEGQDAIAKNEQRIVDEAYQKRLFKKTSTLTMDDIAKFTVDRHKLEIEAEITTKSGDVLAMEVSTLHFAWHSLDDEIGLLNYAGLNVKKRQINLAPDLQVAAQAESKRIEGLMHGLYAEARQVLKGIVKQPLFDGENLSDQYFEGHFEDTENAFPKIEKLSDTLKKSKKIDGASVTPAIDAVAEKLAPAPMAPPAPPVPTPVVKFVYETCDITPPSLPHKKICAFVPGHPYPAEELTMENVQNGTLSHHHCLMCNPAVTYQDLVNAPENKD